jgi:6-phosphofructokinase 1
MATKKLKRLGILTAGGDCPGLNAVIRAVVRSAAAKGLDCVGFRDGYRGLVLNQTLPLDSDRVAGILTLGGTILGSSNRDDPFRFIEDFSAPTQPMDRSDDCVKHLAHHGVDALVVLGGDGSMTVARKLERKGVRVVGVPKTIDNDLRGTERCFGHDTAVGVAAEAIDRLHTTASSHHRVMVIELMGREAGWLSLRAGLASGADAILIPEIDCSAEVVAELVQSRMDNGRSASIVVVAEGARPGGKAQVRQIVKGSPEPVRLGGVGDLLAKDLERLSGVEARAVVLGHIVRGGTPSASDRIFATALGVAAVDLLVAGGHGRMVTHQAGGYSSVPLSTVAGKVRLVPKGHPLLVTARAMGVSFGDKAVSRK